VVNAWEVGCSYDSGSAPRAPPPPPVKEAWLVRLVGPGCILYRECTQVHKIYTVYIYTHTTPWVWNNYSIPESALTPTVTGRPSPLGWFFLVQSYHRPTSRPRGSKKNRQRLCSSTSPLLSPLHSSAAPTPPSRRRRPTLQLRRDLPSKHWMKVTICEERGCSLPRFCPDLVSSPPHHVDPRCPPNDGSAQPHPSPCVTAPALASCEPLRSVADGGLRACPHRWWDLGCLSGQILQSTMVDPSRHATSSLSFSKRQTPAFQSWIVRLHERSYRLAPVPDGVYIFKISVFPYEISDKQPVLSFLPPM
jgi:hypothetical protein